MLEIKEDYTAPDFFDADDDIVGQKGDLGLDQQYQLFNENAAVGPTPRSDCALFPIPFREFDLHTRAVTFGGKTRDKPIRITIDQGSITFSACTDGVFASSTTTITDPRAELSSQPIEFQTADETRIKRVFSGGEGTALVKVDRNKKFFSCKFQGLKTHIRVTIDPVEPNDNDPRVIAGLGTETTFDPRAVKDAMACVRVAAAARNGTAPIEIKNGVAFGISQYALAFVKGDALKSVLMTVATADLDSVMSLLGRMGKSASLSRSSKVQLIASGPLKVGVRIPLSGQQPSGKGFDDFEPKVTVSVECGILLRHLFVGMVVFKKTRSSTIDFERISPNQLGWHARSNLGSFAYKADIVSEDFSDSEPFSGKVSYELLIRMLFALRRADRITLGVLKSSLIMDAKIGGLQYRILLPFILPEG